MTLPRTLALLPVALSIACVVPTKPLGGADSEDDGGDGMPTSSDDDPSTGSDSLSGTGAGSGSAGSEGSSSEGGMESTDSGGGSTTDDPDTDGGSSGEACVPLECEACDPACQTVDECVDGEWVCDCICPPEFCDFEEITCDQAEQSKTPPVDCGVATLDDDLDQWNTVHDCVLTQAGSQNAFKGVFYLQGIDSSPRQSFVGQVGFVYALGELFQDYGGLGDPLSTVHLQPCTGLTHIPDCQLSVGFSCIQCLQQGDSQILCQEEE